MAALRLNGKWVEVATMQAASEMVRKDIDATGVGSEEWYSYGKTQGEVRRDGKKVGRVSYNGRVWVEGVDTNVIAAPDRVCAHGCSPWCPSCGDLRA